MLLVFICLLYFFGVEWGQAIGPLNATYILYIVIGYLVCFTTSVGLALSLSLSLSLSPSHPLSLALSLPLLTKSLAISFPCS